MNKHLQTDFILQWLKHTLYNTFKSSEMIFNFLFTVYDKTTANQNNYFLQKSKIKEKCNKILCFN